MMLIKTRILYILRQQYKETGQEPVLGEKVGCLAKAFNENEADTVLKAHAYYRFSARMLEPIISKQYMICISHNRI
jgi:putative transposase